MAAVDELEQQGMKALVLDLRNNSGGLFDACLKMSDLFLQKGKIVKVYSRGKLVKEFEVDPTSKKYNFPLVVLANGNSASASEILVGALKDHERATIIGESTYGKGVIQAVHPIEYADSTDDSVNQDNHLAIPESAIAITIGKYLTPNGTDIHGKGINPNVWYDYNNRINNDTTLMEYNEELDKLLQDLRSLRAKQMTYLRNTDAIVEKSMAIAKKKLQGEVIPDVPQLEPEIEEHKPLSMIESN
jgi:carboxyl-terminal processing protease